MWPSADAIAGADQPPLVLYAVNTAAVRNFYNKYGETNHETWYALDNGYRAKFQRNGIAYMADYNKQGLWLQTIKTYQEDKLPRDIRNKVRREYLDHHIFLVQEINHRRDVVYLLRLEDTHSWMVLRVAGDDMDPGAEFDK